MSLTTRQRSSIFQKLVPVLGEEDADALMAEFPAAEHDVLVTREHLRAEMAELRGEFAEFRASLRSELRADIRSELRGMATKAELAEAVSGLATKAELAEAVSGLATKAELRAELSELRTEVHAHINRAMGATTGVLLAAMGLLATLT